MRTRAEFKHHPRQPGFRGEAVPLTQSPQPRLGLILGAGQHLRTADGAKRFDLSVIDLDDPALPLTLIPMDFFGHGIAADPLNPQCISVFEKRGRGACEIDLGQGRVSRSIPTADNRQFYGHGAYSHDGRLLFCTETIMEGDCPGVIAVRDARSHDYLGEFPSYGAHPHDCRLIDDGRTLVVTNGGGPREGAAPNVAYIDIRSEQLLEKLEFERRDINAGHLDIAADGSLAVISAQRQGLPQQAPGGISLRPAGGGFRTLRKPSGLIKRLRGETLSVRIHAPTGVVGATTPEGNLLTFWDMASGELIRFYELENPRGIELTRDGEHFVVSFGFRRPAEALTLFSARTLEKVEGFDLDPVAITGSHLFSYSLPSAA